MSAHFKISRFKTIYDEMIQMNSSKKHFLVCLEALHFQYKMFITEQESLTRLLLMLLNRVYRDYFNYYNVILKELPKYEVHAPVIAKQHLVYKDAEPNTEFQPEDIALVFENMMSLLYSVSLKYNENETVIHQYKVRSVSGIFIGNLINTLEYDNRVLDDHASLFIKSIDFTLKTQASYFSKTLKRFQCAVEDIDNEVSFQESPWDNSGMSVADQVVQKTDDGYPMVSQWTSPPKEDLGCPPSVGLGCPPKVGLDPEPKVDLGCPPKVGLGCPPSVGLDPEPKVDLDPEPKALGCPPSVGLDAEPNVALGCPPSVGLDAEPNVALGCPPSVGLDAEPKALGCPPSVALGCPPSVALEDEIVGMTIDEIKEL
jgi:hypothetical protein